MLIVMTALSVIFLSSLTVSLCDRVEMTAQGGLAVWRCGDDCTGRPSRVEMTVIFLSSLTVSLCDCYLFIKFDCFIM
jgi:hypothetical protein